MILTAAKLIQEMGVIDQFLFLLIFLGLEGRSSTDLFEVAFAISGKYIQAASHL